MSEHFKPQIKVNLLIEDPSWKKIKSLRSQIHEGVIKTLNQIDFFDSFGKAELTIKLAGDDELLLLNKTYLNKNKPTNVLSFPFFDAIEGDFQLSKKLKKLYIGDLALSHATIYNECKEQNKIFEHHFMHLLIHGLLHLCGFDHNVAKKAKRMETLEIEILKHFNIINPYDKL